MEKSRLPGCRYRMFLICGVSILAKSSSFLGLLIFSMRFGGSAYAAGCASDVLSKRNVVSCVIVPFVYYRFCLLMIFLAFSIEFIHALAG